jgi:hypothetical protein
VLPEQLEVAPIPYELQHVWDWWMQLQATRSMGMEANHISYQEIANWSKLLNVKVTALEVRSLIALDSAYMNHCAAVRAANKPST